MDRVKVVVECGNDPGCHDVELHVTREVDVDANYAVQPSIVLLVASYGTTEEAEEHAARLRNAFAWSGSP